MTMIHTPATHIPNTTIDQSESFWSAAFDEAREAMLSIDRCIDWLLDLYQSTEHPALRELVADMLDDLRAVSAEGLGFADLDLDDVVLGALASIETAFEIYG
ncbi:MAG: hypothetical protein R2710_00945 [Acidimicrobiales bacterium]